ncbi:glycosyltransferase family 4 protein [Aminobacter carboxidus]|uniref:Glycosyltransferase family 4 protein n=1 Tax=Aminobacter carboxidus TaxID=376165 RepID=A0A8E1WJG6_9HYPH|nr:glycosyltransferase family 4 protein [Aminobacter lissarensis]MBB6468485.1 glycosyltransferase involved in cell wall biosynthesis [Aminobacter lissarensis]MBE1205451.1 glycosyltransferase family 4 protein [Aminobacter carboxidus]
MKIAYLLNTYPIPSTTFIRGEIEALEDLGLRIGRLSVRRFGGTLVDRSDQSEMESTHYLLSGNATGLFVAFGREILINPRGLLRALPALQQMRRKAYSGFVHHIAYLMQACYLRQEARRQGIAHVHAHFGTNPAAVALLSKLLGGPSYSFTSHGPDEFTDAAYLSFDLKIKHAAFVVAISDYCSSLLTSLSDAADAHKVVIARCGLKLEDFAPTPIARDQNTLVCIGRLCQQKGQIHIPAAVAALRAEFPDMKVVLVGDGESRAEIEAEIARHDVGAQVILRGWSSNDEVRQLLKQSRAMLLPSYAEGLPVAIMEALALTRPVISTTIAGIPELVDEECGWLVEPGNHQQLVAAMRSALAAPADVLERMGKIGRQRVERLHDRKLLALELQRLFMEATSNGRDGSSAQSTLPGNARLQPATE